MILPNSRNCVLVSCCVALAVLSSIGCGDAGRSEASEDSQSVTLALNWYADAQHGGFYAAQHFGFFEQEGLDVRIVPGGPAAPVVPNVAMRRVDFGVGNADQILMAREQEAPVVAVMAAMQNSPRCIMVHKETGIQRIADLKDVTLALGAGKAFVRYLEDNGHLKGVQVVPYTGSIALFLNEPRFAQQAYVFSEPFVAQRKGVDPHCMMVSDLGFNPYTSCLMMHEERLASDPELAEKMIRAVRRGWRAYLRDPEPVNRLINRDNPEMDLDSLRFAVDAIRPLCLGGEITENSIGSMSDERWQTLATQLVEIGSLETAEQVGDAYTLQFLKELAPE